MKSEKTPVNDRACLGLSSLVAEDELERAKGLKHLDGFIYEHALYVLMGLVYLLVASGIGLILLLRKSLKGKGRIRPVIFINLPGLPLPPPDTFDPFPPPHHPAYDDYRDD